ncbi:LOW QUALITY PROTEIN: leucine-rich repeat-containing protein 72 [Strigops habroptila]|uniref:LOW QUALITY PROTEIN: leucine-rich repeat-containing protein 72 n=1 Tax=Strigops habroptila TaxID=2489341 RepID=UPI0011CF57C7|nr:LOW QUALITY PROTEIN: leucine-rich repeat-containing protein 72 [Strigops habroptila]
MTIGASKPFCVLYYADKCTVYCKAGEKQLKICGFKRNVDVLVLYLAGRSGALKHFCVLQVLFLHNNQLKNLGKTVKGLKGIISLQTLTILAKFDRRKKSLRHENSTESTSTKKKLPNEFRNLFHNPLAQDPDYWLYVIHLLPAVQLLDRKSVTQRERKSALHLCNYERLACVMQSIAFGKRVDTPLETTVGSSRCTQPARRVMMPSGSEFGNQRNKEPFENPEDAVLLRAMARSLMEFSYVDWNNVATPRERRLENKAAAEACKKLTVLFR